MKEVLDSKTENNTVNFLSCPSDSHKSVFNHGLKAYIHIVSANSLAISAHYQINLASALNIWLKLDITQYHTISG